MNHTTNYNLSQWAKSDQVRMEDFNADNAKIDAAIKAVAQVKTEIIAGTYTGDSAESREINLGRAPKAVYVCRDNGETYNSGFYLGGLALSGAPATYRTYSKQYPIIALTNTGFIVYYSSITNSSKVATNESNATYHYIAFF